MPVTSVPVDEWIQNFRQFLRYLGDRDVERVADAIADELAQRGTIAATDVAALRVRLLRARHQSSISAPRVPIA